MANDTYIATGQVIDRDSGDGVAGLLVQAFDSDPERSAQVLGNGKTDDNGRFSISFSLKQFNYETAPDLFFKVFSNEQLLESTESSVLWNANTQESVTIRVSTARQRPPGKDRITSTQVFKGVDFLQKSDFKGVFNDYRSKAGTSMGMVVDIIKNTFGKMDLKPIQVKGSRQSDVIHQDVNVARANLAAKNVEVKEVADYNPGLNADSLRNITALKTIQPGQQVKLFQKEGKVLYYSIIQPPASAPADVSKDLADHASQISGLQLELKTARDEAAKKDELITTLQKEVASLQKSQSDINTLLRSDNFTKLIASFKTPKDPKKPK
jgi:hypothetical protein